MSLDVSSSGIERIKSPEIGVEKWPDGDLEERKEGRIEWSVHSKCGFYWNLAKNIVKSLTESWPGRNKKLVPSTHNGRKNSGQKKSWPKK